MDYIDTIKNLNTMYLTPYSPNLTANCSSKYWKQSWGEVYKTEILVLMKLR